MNTEQQLTRAKAVIDCLRIFYPNQVDRAENLVDYAMKTKDNTPREATNKAIG